MGRDNSRTLIAFGIGNNFYPLVERLDKICKIEAFSDNDCSKWGQHLMGDERVCVRPDAIKEFENPVVLIMSERESSIRAIEKQCDDYGLIHQRVNEFLASNQLESVECHWPQAIQQRRIHKFIELLVHGTTACNFHCEYCYVWRKQDFSNEIETSEHSPKEWREALSVKRLGGPCHINACAHGETLLSKDIVALSRELLEEGHYLSIITNGTVSKRIDEILQFPKELLDRMFFKLSFHYAELKRTNLYERFWENVDKIKKSPCSYSIEITPCDSLIKDIEVIKSEFEKRAGGAMPHITFTRDGNKEGLDLLSELSLEEYKNTWKVFESELFNMKCDLYKKKICEECYAGNWSYRVNVVNGNLQSCYQQKLSGTIFDNIHKALPILTVGKGCQLDYCFNNHAFLAWGDAPQIKCPQYIEVRDRVAKDGSHWIKEPYSAAMSQKFYQNNFSYRGRWSDYEKLFADNRGAAIILFNSPDYTNLGDHAIALAEKQLFEKLFPDKDFIEISCEQYIKENMLLQNVIREDDVLVINGGGYLGSLWLWLEDITKNIIQTYRKNKILIFPQTMFFDESNLGETEKKSLASVCNEHKDLTMMFRDVASFERATGLFQESVKKLLIPDIVMSMEYEKKKERSGALFMLRDDKESLGINGEALQKYFVNRDMEVKRFSTISDSEVYLDNRKECLDKLLDTIAGANVVVTDRLHAMIFCAITGTPCVAFDNVSGKVSEAYQWLKELEYIVICKQQEKFEECLNKVINRADKEQNKTAIFEEKFAELEKYLKETCFV